MRNSHLLVLILLIYTGASCQNKPVEPDPESTMSKIHISGKNFETKDGETFRIWGFNISGADSGLLADGWEKEATMLKHRKNFKDMKDMGANFIRMHLQYNTFMTDPETPDKESLSRLKKLISYAEQNELYVDITGLGAYRKSDQPEWYDAMDESERWATQRIFWRSVAGAVGGSPAVFCYDLMNEPVAAVNVKNGWLPSDEPFGDFYYVQNITLDLKGRSTQEAMGQWIDTLTQAIREVDSRTPITVGLLGFPGLVPLGDHLDFLSTHLYPKSGEIEKSTEMIDKFQTSKPLLIEETFPLKCSSEELKNFIRDNNPEVSGWVSHYFGKTIEELTPPQTIGDGIRKEWYETFMGMSGEQK